MGWAAYGVETVYALGVGVNISAIHLISLAALKVSVGLFSHRRLFSPDFVSELSIPGVNTSDLAAE